MPIWIWFSFIVLILGFIALDLGVFHRKSAELKIKKELAWTVFWIVLALSFSFVVYYLYETPNLSTAFPFASLSGHKAALQYLTGYIIEKSLSVDNLFVISVVFSYFHIKLKYQHRILFWGILGALVFRGLMIMLGALLIQKFSWSFYLFGAFLLLTAVKLLVDRKENVHLEKNILVRLVEKFFTVDHTHEQQKFFVRKRGKLAVTSLFLALIVIEGSDVVFALDSIPAIFAITQDPFLVFTSNVFAILGLRSLYFVLAAMIDKFRYLKVSLAFILVWVGLKMLLHHHFIIPTWVSLVVILVILMVGVAASSLAMSRNDQQS